MWHFDFLLLFTIPQIESVSSLLGLNNFNKTDRAQTTDCPLFKSLFYLVAVAEPPPPASSAPTIQKPIVVHGIELVPSTNHAHDLCPKDTP
jgi:hypothetical protein